MVVVDVGLPFTEDAIEVTKDLDMATVVRPVYRGNRGDAWYSDNNGCFVIPIFFSCFMRECANIKKTVSPLARFIVLGAIYLLNQLIDVRRTNLTLRMISNLGDRTESLS